MSKQVMCICEKWPNPLYNGKVQIGDILTVIWEGLSSNPPHWMNGESHRCYMFKEIPPSEDGTFISEWDVRGFVELDSDQDERIIHAERIYNI